MSLRRRDSLPARGPPLDSERGLYTLCDEATSDSEKGVYTLCDEATASDSEYDPAIELQKQKSDKWSLLLLLLLYTLQGIPMGLAGSIPLILQNKHVSYSQQAIFSLVSWPFSLKLLWAPIVDSIYSPSLGRRKSWLIAMQLVASVLLLASSSMVDGLLGGPLVATTPSEHHPHSSMQAVPPPNVTALTILFLVLYFLLATQDIAVDGWALTMLSRKRVGYASTANTVGQNLGYFIAYFVFLALYSPEFCIKYLPSSFLSSPTEGLITLGGFMGFFGWVFLLTTLGVWIGKKEQPERHDNGSLSSSDLSAVTNAYSSMWRVITLPSVKLLAMVLLVSRIAFAAVDNVAHLKLLEKGLPKEQLALFAVASIPFGILCPIVVNKFTSGPRPLDVWRAAYPIRIVVGILVTLVVYFAPQDMQNIPLWFYAALLAVSLVQMVVSNVMFVAAMAFFARVCDPAIGGTYMTLLNTLMNLSGLWPSSLALYFIEPLTIKSCQGSAGSIDGQSCSSIHAEEMCQKAGGECVVQWDGFYVQVALCSVLGLAWLRWAAHKLQRLQAFKSEQWKVPMASRKQKNVQ